MVSPKGEIYGSLTTPDPVELHRTLDQLAGEGVTHLAIEASSHGLDQHRLDGVRVAAGGFTNLTRDHLDYHPTSRPISRPSCGCSRIWSCQAAAAVIDVDDCYAGQVVEAAKKRGLKVMTVGEHGDDIQLIGGAIDGFAQIVSLGYGGKTFKVKLPLVGAFQVQNAAVAAGLAIATGAEAARVFAALEKLTGAKGRFELVGSATARRFSSTTPTSPTRWRRRSRRCAPMPAASSSSCSAPAATATPASARSWGGSLRRTPTASSSPTTIRAARSRPRSAPLFLPRLPGATEIGDRGEAIREGIAALKTGDVLLIAGKGHEIGQIIGDRVLHFSDHEAVAAALQGKVA